MATLNFNNATYTGPTKRINGKEVPHGQGTVRWHNGEKYSGNFIDGKRTGYGTYTWPSGLKYVGEFYDGIISGSGERTYPPREPDDYGVISERGLFRDGELVEGTIKYNSGGSIKAKFDNNQQIIGDATYINKNQDKIVGPYRYRNNEGGRGRTLIRSYGEYKCYDKTGKLVYEGYMDNSGPINGTMYYPNGSVYTGGFKNYRKNGQGVTRSKSATTKGNYKNGVRHGFFTIHYYDGWIEESMWKNGKRDGACEQKCFLDKERKYLLKMVFIYKNDEWSSCYAYLNDKALNHSLEYKGTGSNAYAQIEEKQIETFKKDAPHSDDPFSKNYLSLLKALNDNFDFTYYSSNLYLALKLRLEILFTLFKMETELKFDKNNKVIFDKEVNDINKAIDYEILNIAASSVEESVMTLAGGDKEANEILAMFPAKELLIYCRPNGDYQHAIYKVKNDSVFADLFITDTNELKSLNEKYDPEKVEPSYGLAVRRVFPFFSYQITGMGFCNDPTLVIPESIDHVNVKSIKKRAFYENPKLISVDLDVFLKIEKEAFAKCHNLRAIYIRKTMLTPEPAYDAFSYLANLEKIFYSSTKHDFVVFFRNHYWLRNIKSKKKVIVECTDGKFYLSKFFELYPL